MADLETILDSQDTTENKNTLSHIVSDNSVKSPSRKENILPPPLPPIPTILINNGNVFPFNKSFNAGLLNFKKRYNSELTNPMCLLRLSKILLAAAERECQARSSSARFTLL